MNTLFLLLAEYESAHVPVEVVAEKYLGLGRTEAFAQANQAKLPFPVIKSSSKRAPWIVDLRDVAAWLDTLRALAKKDWERLQ